MKPKTFFDKPLFLSLAIVGMTLMLVSWNPPGTPRHYGQGFSDTIPKNKTDRVKKIRDLDDVLDELNSVDLNIEMEKVNREVQEAMKNYDGEKLKMDIEKAIKEVDFEKIQKEVTEAMSKMDWEKMRKDIEESCAKIDWGKIQKEVNESMASVDWDKIRGEMESVKKIDFEKINLEMKKVGEEMKKLGPELEKAKVEIEKAKADVREYKEFVNGLESDGLIDKKAGYTIRHKNGELNVNGKKVSDATYSKYKTFLKKHPTFRIEKTDDDFDLDMD